MTLLKSYGFITETNDKYYLTELSKEFLVNYSLFDLSSYVDSLKDRPICLEMLKVLQTGQPINWSSNKNSQDWTTEMNNDSFAEKFTNSQNSRGVYLANGILNCIDFLKQKRLLDIGGSSGIYSVVILEKYKNLSATIFEKFPVNRISEYFINKYSINNIDVITGDMFKDNFPENYDIHLLSHVLHDWSENEVELILKKSFNSLAPNGLLIIHDAHINEDKNGPISVAEYSVLLMSSTYGKCYSINELTVMLMKIGFKNISFKKSFVNRSVIIAKK
jgi:predicted nicotinamide N-methyase